MSFDNTSATPSNYSRFTCSGPAAFIEAMTKPPLTADEAHEQLEHYRAAHPQLSALWKSMSF